MSFMGLYKKLTTGLTQSHEWHFPFGGERLGRDFLPLILVL